MTTKLSMLFQVLGLWLHFKDTEMFFLGSVLTVTGIRIKKVQKELLHIYLHFYLIPLPCLRTFWHAIPTSFYTSNVLYFLYIEPNHTPSGKKTVTGVKVVTASQV